MKKLLSVLMLISILFVSDFYAQNAPCSDCGNLVISTIVNGRISAKHGMQICAINDIADLSNYHLVYETSNLSDSEFIGYDRDGTGTQSTVTIFSGSLLAGECIWVVEDIEDFTEYMEGTVDATSFIEGPMGTAVDDDRNLMIICRGNIDDIYGYYVPALDEDGDSSTDAADDIPSDDPAYYEDTWVISNNDRCPNGGTMDITNWTVGPIDALKEDSNGDNIELISQSNFPGANFTTSNGPSCANVRTCGGLQLCSTVKYECVENETSLDDFLMKIDYIGMEPGIEITQLEMYDCNITIHPSSDDPATTPDGTIVLLNVESTPGCGSGSTLWGLEFISPSCDGIQFWSRVPEQCMPECSNGVQDGDEEGVDCGGSCPNACTVTAEPTCSDGIQNGDEEGIDCGGSCTNACETGGDTCLNGVQDGDEEGIDCGGSCANACETGGDTCTNGVQDGDEEGVDCGGSCTNTCETGGDSCSNGVQDGDEEGVDCGGSCANACETGGDTCTNGVQDGDEEGIDCGGSCANACITAPTCTDGIQNGDEAGVDCGGTNCPACPVATSCTDGIQNGDEQGIDCGGSCANPCGDVVSVPTMSEWGLIILSLFMLNFVFINVIVGKMAVQGFNNQTINMFNWKNLNSYPFSAALFRRAVHYTIGILILIAIFALVVYGFFTTTDVVGLAIASPIFAYLLHLFLIANELTSDNS